MPEGDYQKGDLLKVEPFNSMKGDLIYDLAVSKWREDMLIFKSFSKKDGMKELSFTYEPGSILGALLFLPPKNYTFFSDWQPDLYYKLDSHILGEKLRDKYPNLKIEKYPSANKLVNKRLPDQRIESIELQSIEYQFMMNLFGKEVIDKKNEEWEGQWEYVKFITDAETSFEFMYMEGSLREIKYEDISGKKTFTVK